MKTIHRLLACAAMAVFAVPTCYSADFFDTGEPTTFFTVGARLGLNTSVRTMGSGHAFNNVYNGNHWGMGSELGVVADINIRDWLSIEPGFFLGYRHGSYSYVGTRADLATTVELGDSKRLVATIPVMCVAHFNVNDNFRWSVEAGPYCMLNIGDSESNPWLSFNTPNTPASQRKGKTDFGLKIGTGLTYNYRYSFHVHYLWGMEQAWKENLGGHNKAWTFTLGYTF